VEAVDTLAQGGVDPEGRGPDPTTSYREESPIVTPSIRRRQRRGAAAVETALVLPAAVFFILMILIGGAGVFRYNELALLTREGARYASVHGKQYERETGNTAATADDVFNNAIKPKAALLNPDRLTYSVTWDTDNWPNRIEGDARTPITNTVTVTLSYQWEVEIPFVRTINLSSTSTMQMWH
jgi:Flp pilus assembly protein TadG